MMYHLKSDDTQSAPQELVWASERQLHVVKEKVSQIALQWCRQWSKFERTPLTVRTTLGSSDQLDIGRVEVWTQVKRNHSHAAWLGLCGSKRRAIEQALFDEPLQQKQEPNHNDLHERIIVRAWEDLLAKFIDLTGLTGASIDFAKPIESVLRPWSGAVFVELTIDTIPLFLILSKDIVSTICGPDEKRLSAPERKKPVASLQYLVRKQYVSLNASLQGCELDFGSLEQLRVGDVVKLEHKLDQALMLNTLSGDFICHAYLGRIVQNKAIELVIGDRL